MKGSFIISLDFELLWGGIEKRGPRDYGQSHVSNVPKVIDELLCLFAKYNVHATFATVGLLMLDGKEAVKKYAPSKHPSYNNHSLSPYLNGYIDKIEERDERLYFVPDVVKKIQMQEGMEIGTHTFCHYYCWEKGQTAYEFEADIKAAISVADERGFKITSIVFPRNQVPKEYLRICAENGIVVYRGNPDKWFGPYKSSFEAKKSKIFRFIDYYFPIGGHNTYDINLIESECGIYNVKASRYLRPYDKRLALFDGLKYHRIKKEIEYAAKHGQMYHLWWHPHNFGNNVAENIAFLEKILKVYSSCKSKYDMSSFTMTEYANNIQNY